LPKFAPAKGATEPHPEEWLLIEWPQGETEPTKYWFASLPEDFALDRLVDIAKLRWRIERDYQELKTGARLWRLRRSRVARLPPTQHSLSLPTGS
jgi:hypothetical protein